MVLWQPILEAVLTLIPCLVDKKSDALVDSQILRDPYPYHFPKQGSDELFPMRRCHGFKLEEATIDDIQTQLSLGKLTSVDLVECYTGRIFQTDGYVKYESCVQFRKPMH